MSKEQTIVESVWVPKGLSVSDVCRRLTAKRIFHGDSASCDEATECEDSVEFSIEIRVIKIDKAG